MTAHAFDRMEAVIIINPKAHNRPGRKKLARADDWLRAQGWNARWLETAGPGEATGMAAQAADRGVPLVFVCGGDGTLNEAVNGLACSETAVAVIPGGTSNLWAREIGLLKEPAQAVQLAAEGVRRRVDLGRAGSRYFLLMAGYGIDAAVIHRVSLAMKGRLGAAAYVLSAIRRAMSHRSSHVTVSMDGERRHLDMLLLVAGNTRLYAGVTQITREAVVDDGRLDVCLYEGRGRRDIIWLALLTLLGRHGRSKKVTQRRVSELTLSWAEPPLAQLDGDGIEESPAQVTVVPGALWVMTPQDVMSPLFSRPPGPG